MKNNLSIFAIVILGVIIMAFTELRTITGKVTDNSGKPLQGVIVTVEGATTVVSTDQYGYYKISVDQQAKILSFFTLFMMRSLNA